MDKNTLESLPRVKYIQWDPWNGGSGTPETVVTAEDIRIALTEAREWFPTKASVDEAMAGVENGMSVSDGEYEYRKVT
jgi:hypothetical protein